MQKLKPCPFCGGEIETKDFDFIASHLYRCKKCKSGFILQPVTGFSAEDVWNMKNTKYFPSEVQQALDKQKPELAIITKELGYHPDGDVYEVGCPDCGKVLRYVNFVRGATTDCIRYCMDCGKKMNVRIDAEVEDE